MFSNGYISVSTKTKKWLFSWTQIQQYMTKDAEFISRTNRSESKKNRKQGEGRSFTSKQLKSILRLPVTAQNVLIVLYGIIIGLGLVTNTAILLAFFKNKVREVFVKNKVSEVFSNHNFSKIVEFNFFNSAQLRCSEIKHLGSKTAAGFL